MPSFDVVSKVDWHEIDNALHQANKEIGQRFDFKGSNTSIEVKDGALVVESTDEFKVKASVEVLEAKLAKRSVPLGALDKAPIEDAAGGRARQKIAVKSGIDQDAARAIVKAVKQSKMKVQAAVQGDMVRISGKKRDDLQAAIQLLKGQSFGQPLQFENFRD
jgi:uncharacterized protein YajQ (UPF0234 family)